MQPPEQTTEQGTEQRRVGNPAWVRGRSANPRGRESKAARMSRRDRLIEEWTADIGGPASLTAAEIALLSQAAELAMAPSPRTHEDRIRYANTIAKILRQVGLVDRRGKRRLEPQHIPLREALAVEVEDDEEPAA